MYWHFRVRPPRGRLHSKTRRMTPSTSVFRLSLVLAGKRHNMGSLPVPHSPKMRRQFEDMVLNLIERIAPETTPDEFRHLGEQLGRRMAKLPLTRQTPPTRSARYLWERADRFFEAWWR